MYGEDYTAIINSRMELSDMMYGDDVTATINSRMAIIVAFLHSKYYFFIPNVMQ